MRAFFVLALASRTCATTSLAACEGEQCLVDAAPETTTGNTLLATRRDLKIVSTPSVHRMCQQLGKGKHKGDGDSVFGCRAGTETIDVWSMTSAELKANGGQGHYSQERCHAEALMTAGCGNRVLYREDGRSCLCLKEKTQCTPMNRANFFVSECECGFHPGKTCVVGGPVQYQVMSMASCFDWCVSAGAGCCHWASDSKGGLCAHYPGGGADSFWDEINPYTGKENDYAFNVEECLPKPYTFVSGSETCLDAGFDLITTKADCELAGSLLRKESWNGIARVDGSASSRPCGCMWHPALGGNLEVFGPAPGCSTTRKCNADGYGGCLCRNLP